MASDNFLIVAAIDFGTTYSGYAFSTTHDFRTDPAKISLVQWSAGSGSLTSSKTSTCVLFNPDRSFNSFGYAAEDKYSNLILDKKHDDWYLFRRFKMYLYNTKVDRDILLTDYSGKKQMPMIDVISATLGFLKSHLMEKCRDQVTGVKDSEVRWVVTVPAIWTDAAKQLMREAAEKAGIGKRQLMLCLEPEAASVFCKHIPVEKDATGDHREFQAGSKYMVIDAGGGTIDITVHKVQKDGNLKEIRAANGGDWGGTKVDEAFGSFLENIIGSRAFHQFNIYASTNEKPKYVTDASCQKIGEVKVELPEPTRGLETVVCVSMCFGGSEIDITAKDEATGRSVRAVCDFLG